jgi:hypothetical protein
LFGEKIRREYKDETSLIMTSSINSMEGIEMLNLHNTNKINSNWEKNMLKTIARFKDIFIKVKAIYSLHNHCTCDSIATGTEAS